MNTNQNINAVAKSVIIVLALWLGLVAFLAGRGWLTQPAGTPPIAIVLAVTIPIAVFLSAYRWSKRFHEFILTLDLRLVVMVQAWQFAGFGFLALHANNVLPGMFAWPAGLGDMLVGITAPQVLCRLVQRPGFAASKSFINWNLFGILDLVVAVSMGGLSSMLLSGGPGMANMSAITRLPLSLIPTFMVPIFVMLHLAALFQSHSQADIVAARVG